MRIRIRPEEAGDRGGIRDVNEEAFGGKDEADLVDALREGGYASISLVTEADLAIVGHILFSRVVIETDAEQINALSLAPMCVLPRLQRQGIGSQLIEAGLMACGERGDRIVVVLGHPEFYPRFGFSAESARPLASPFGGGEAWMALELIPGALANVVGRVRYSPPFGRFE